MRERTPSITTLAAVGAVLACLAISFPHPKSAPPTPRAVTYAAPIRGERLDLPAVAHAVPLGDGVAPTMLHFYNPRCSCAPAAIEHLASMISGNRDGARFAAVVDPRDGAVALARRQLAFLGITVIPDPGGAIARACGVDSTPEAVVFDAEGRLFFRGGYGDAIVGPHRQVASADAGDALDPYECVTHDPGLTTASVPDDGP